MDRSTSADHLKTYTSDIFEKICIEILLRLQDKQTISGCYYYSKLAIPCGYHGVYHVPVCVFRIKRSVFRIKMINRLAALLFTSTYD